MIIVPVIMCGGSGLRLWPASRSSRPKQFIPLVGELSTFQQTILRLDGVEGASPPLIVAGLAHEAMIRRQIDGLGRVASLLLEPTPRDSAPAMAAAALWAIKQDADAILAVVASDHHIPDRGAFREAIRLAAEDAATRDRIVTLGVRPTEPSTAYGYILPAAEDGAVKPVASFAEKPDQPTASRYLTEGYLWNSGNFIVRAQRLLDELDAYAPGLRQAVQAAIDDVGPDGKLGPSFSEAMKISIDYAVMEKTRHAAVLPVSFAWSDLGAWDAVLQASPRDEDGNAIAGDVSLFGTRNVLARSGGPAVVAIGAENLAIVADEDAVLVCALDASQAVKTAVETLKSRGHAAVDRTSPEDLPALALRLKLWLDAQALPVWLALGTEGGAFVEALTADGRPVAAPRRARVQTRQAYVYARLGAAGWPGPWRRASEDGMAYFDHAFRRPDGQFRSVVAADGRVLIEDAMLYDQAFALLAWSALGREAEAARLMDALEGRRCPGGGYRETGPQPFLSNPNMHLFEAALAWIEAGGGSRWRALADELGHWAQATLARGGAVGEVFDATWRKAQDGADGRIEPGHQFEWAWLLGRWAKLGGPSSARQTAEGLYETGLAGIDAQRGVAVNALTGERGILDPVARLWPQTEWLKAAVELDRRHDALRAAQAVDRYLGMPLKGLWRDKLDADGRWVDEPSPASSLYHLAVAIEILAEAEA